MCRVRVDAGRSRAAATAVHAAMQSPSSSSSHPLLSHPLLLPALVQSQPQQPPPRPLHEERAAGGLGLAAQQRAFDEAAECKRMERADRESEQRGDQPAVAASTESAMMEIADSSVQSNAMPRADVDTPVKLHLTLTVSEQVVADTPDGKRAKRKRSASGDAGVRCAPCSPSCRKLHGALRLVSFRSTAAPPLEMKVELVPAAYSVTAALAEIQSPNTRKRTEKALREEYKRILTAPTEKRSPNRKTPKSEPSSSAKKAKLEASPNKRKKTEPAEDLNRRTSARRAAAAATPAEDEMMADEADATADDNAFVKFPALEEASLQAATFDQPFAEFVSSFEKGVDPAVILSETRTSRAPASQLLHVTRLQIYRELCEAYFGRFMKAEETQVRIEKGASRASSRVQKTAEKKESPEQLRMIFCEQFNKSEADRVASSAGLSAKTGIIMVAPIPSSQQLKSLAASDAASVRELMNDEAEVPATLNEHRLQQLDRSPSPPAYAMNPNFDLFQYAPFVTHDQYEVLYDDFTHQSQQHEDEHPTLPSFRQQEADSTAAAASSHGKAAPAAGDGNAGPNYNQYHPALGPVSPAEVKDEVMEEPKEEPRVTESTTIEQSNGQASVVVKLPAEQLETPSATVSASASTIVETSQQAAAVEEDGDAIMSDAVKVESAGEQKSEMTATSSVVDAMGEPTREAIAAADAAAASGQSATLPRAGSASVASSSSSADVSGSRPAISLPSTQHGVGMMASLDFNSDLCAPWKTHWTQESFSWKFDNLTRTFVGGAYDPANRRQNDVQLATGIIQQAQKVFHQALLEDELEENQLAENIRMGTRSKRQRKARDGEDGETTGGGSDTLARGGHGYPVDSDEYKALRNRISASFESSLAHSLFLPHTYLRTVAPRLHDRAIRMSQECVEELGRKFVLPPEERAVDDTFGLVVPGFGCEGTQVFLKIGLCVTMLHDEIGWCSALNYMTVRSRGCALWIGLNMHKASVKWSKDRLRNMIHEKKFNLAHFMAEARKAGLQPSMQVQLPGTCIYSPSGRGSAHIVITMGSWVEQIAINHSLSARGLNEAMGFWEGVEPLLHNSALATRCVVPLLWLTKTPKWDLGLGEQLQVLTKLEEMVRREGKFVMLHRDYANPDDQEMYCRHCFGRSHRAILYVQIDGCCPGCFVDLHEEYHHFGTMIDRRFK
jgi:hypothetical protein